MTAIPLPDPFADVDPAPTRRPTHPEPAHPSDFESAHAARPAAAAPLSARPAPHSAQAEESLISCCFLDPQTCVPAAIERGITPESFHLPACRIIFGVIQDLHHARQSFDITILAERLRISKQIDQVGGLGRLVQLAGLAPTSAFASEWIARVRDYDARRQAIRHAQRLLEASHDESVSISDFLSITRDNLALTNPNRPKAEPFALWRPGQFLAHTPDPSAYLLGDGFIERGEWTSVVGIGGLGKTRLVVFFAICQMTGRDFCGIPTQGAPQRTVIFSTENGLRRWKNDLERYLSPRPRVTPDGTTSTPLLTEAQRQVVDDHLFIQIFRPDDDGDLNLGSPETVARIQATLQAVSPGIVVFDPFADMVAGDENSTEDVVNTLRNLNRLTRQAAPQAAVLIVHHARTGAANIVQAGDNYNAGNFGRGSKALYSRVRCELQLAPQDRDNPHKLVLSCGKANNTQKFTTRGIVFDPESFEYSVDCDFDLEEWRNDVTGVRKKSPCSIAEIVQIIVERSGSSLDPVQASDIIADLEPSGAHRATIFRMLKSAATAGYIRHGKTRGSWLLGSNPLPRA